MTEDLLTDTTDTTDSNGWYSNDAATFGDRVTAAREARGYSTADLARKLGVKQKTVQAWEDDLAETRANKLQMLSGVLNVSLMWLLNGEGDGLAEPDTEVALSLDTSEILTEIRQLKTTITHAAEKLGGLEKRLRKALRQPVG